MLSPAVPGYTHGSAGTDPCSGLSESGAPGCRRPRPECAPDRPGNPAYPGMRLFPFGPPQGGHPGMGGGEAMWSLVTPARDLG